MSRMEQGRVAEDTHVRVHMHVWSHEGEREGAVGVASAGHSLAEREARVSGAQWGLQRARLAGTLGPGWALGENGVCAARASGTGARRAATTDQEKTRRLDQGP